MAGTKAIVFTLAHFHKSGKSAALPQCVKALSPSGQNLVNIALMTYVENYCIGWRITEADLSKHPHLKMATSEDDTGVIISFNSESEGVEDSIMVPNGTRTLGINPLNWTTDSTPADKSLNKGACFTKYSGAIKQEIPQLTGAYLDAERGTLIVTDVEPGDYSSSLFPDGVYHLYDYQFFYRNLQENVAVRLESFLSNK